MCRRRVRGGRGADGGGRPDEPERRVDAPRRHPRVRHAGGLCARRDGLHAGEERGEHHDEEPDGLRVRLDRVLLHRRGAHVRRLEAGRRARLGRPLHAERLRGRGNLGLDVLLLPDHVRRDDRDDRLGRGGGAHPVPQLPDLHGAHLRVRLPGDGPLDVGRSARCGIRRLDRSPGLPRLRRFDGRPLGRRLAGPRGRDAARPAHRQVPS